MSNITLNLVETANWFCFWVRQRARRKWICLHVYRELQHVRMWTHTSPPPSLWCCPLSDDQNAIVALLMENIHFHFWIINQNKAKYSNQKPNKRFLCRWIQESHSEIQTTKKEREKERRVITKSVCGNDLDLDKHDLTSIAYSTYKNLLITVLPSASSLSISVSAPACCFFIVLRFLQYQNGIWKPVRSTIIL